HSTANKRFSLDLSTNYSFNQNNSSQSQDLLTAFVLQPNYPSPLDDNGELVWYYKGVALDAPYAGENPYSFLKQKYSMKNALLHSNLLLSYKLIDNLVIKSSFGYSGLNSDEYANQPSNSLHPGGYH